MRTTICSKLHAECLKWRAWSASCSCRTRRRSFSISRNSNRPKAKTPSEPTASDSLLGCSRHLLSFFQQDQVVLGGRIIIISRLELRVFLGVDFRVPQLDQAVVV